MLLHSRRFLRSVPITEAQREIYFAAALGDEANCAFNESVTLRLRGEVNQNELSRALELAFARHDALRSSISEDGESLIIAPRFTGVIEHVDLCSSIGTTAESREGTLRAAIEREGKTPFSLTRGPLARATIFRICCRRGGLAVYGAPYRSGWMVGQSTLRGDQQTLQR